MITKTQLSLLLILYIGLIQSSISEDIGDCIQRICRSNKETVSCLHIESFELNYEPPDEFCRKFINELRLYYPNINEIRCLGYLKNMENLFSLEIDNIEQIRIPNVNLLENTALKEISIWSVENGLQKRLKGSWLIYIQGSNMWLKTCKNDIELYNAFNYAPRETNIMEVAVQEDNDQLLDNYKECVRVFCRKPRRDFYCVHPHKFYNVKSVNTKYNKCLAEVTYLKIPALVPKISAGSLDQFTSVVKIEFEGSFETVLAQDLFKNLINLRFIEFNKLEISNALNTSMNIMRYNKNVLLVSHETFRIYSECDRLKVINLKYGTWKYYRL